METADSMANYHPLCRVLMQSLPELCLLQCMSRFLRSFDLTSYRHGKVLFRLISWLVLSKLQSNSAASNSSTAILIFPGNHVTPNSKTIGWSCSTIRNLLNGIEPCSIFVQQRSTTFNMLNGILQHSTSHDILFNICWTAVATFVAQQMSNRVSFALLQRCLVVM